MSDRKTIAASIAVFLVGVAASVAGGILWKSIIAIAAPVVAGLAAAIMILAVAAERE